MRSQKRRRDRIGKIVFLAPVIIIIGVVVYGFIQVTAPGTIDVQAIAQDNYIPAPSNPTTLQVTVAVGQATGTTPTTFSESAAAYVVTYGSIPWYTAPAAKTVDVTSHTTVYAVGVYTVIPKIISVTSTGGFNATTITAEHEVTPVIWINTSNDAVSFSLEGAGTKTLQAGQNLTSIFSSSGDYEYTIATGPASSSSGTVQVQ